MRGADKGHYIKKGTEDGKTGKRRKALHAQTQAIGGLLTGFKNIFEMETFHYMTHLSFRNNIIHYVFIIVIVISVRFVSLLNICHFRIA